MSTSKISSYVRNFEYSSICEYFEALIDGDGEYRLSGISPDMVFELTREFCETRFADKDKYVYGDLAYDMYGNPGRVSIKIVKNKLHGSYNIETHWKPLFSE